METEEEQTVDICKALKTVPFGSVVVLSVVGLSWHDYYTIIVVGQ